MTTIEKCDRDPVRRLMVIALALTATLACAGCGMTGGKLLYFMGYGRGRKIPEKFTLPPGKLLVLVDDPQSLVHWPQARELLAEQVAREIVRNEAVDQVISNRTLLAARQSDPEFDRRSAQAIGQRAGADTVLVLSVQDFEASDQPEETTSAARMSVAVKVIDANETESPSRVRLWPRHGDGHIETISMPATKVHALKSERAIARALAHALGRNVARLFYQHTLGDVEDDELKSVLHVLDASANWQHRVGLGQLLTKLPPDRFTQGVAYIDQAARRIAVDAGAKSSLAAPRRAGIAALAAPALRRECERGGIDLIHAWGFDAATAARAARPDGPLALTVFDPGLKPRDVRVVRTIAESGATGVACAAQRVRRRLVEQGVPFEKCALIRPAVDFAAITDAQRRPIRDELGIAKDALVVLTPPADRNAYGHDAALWSILVRSQLPGVARLIVPGRSPTRERIGRLAAKTEHPCAVIFTEDRYRFEDLFSAADYLVIAATGEIPATPIAWAMASSTPIIAAADYAVAEMLSNDLNAILFKASDRWTRSGLAVCKHYLHPANLAKIKEVARGQAYEVFGLRRCVRQHAALYENLLAGKPAGEGITDPAQQAA